ncbi:SRPBCC family protein [Rhodoferax sp.]|uniref:SRPBCC family protein n=1 Tax=Rhodoferax sp. TaxID=50421 RepID=UPI001EB2BD1B|nr:SRPBCC family protein [Rhodoferax sp.]MBT9508636.1 SRPBCC family protein [Rhodoferax sp.]
MNPRYQFHREATADIAARPQTVFDLLDDHKRLAGHMEKPSLMMAGGTMQIETDKRRGQAVGSQIRVKGRVLGIPLSVEETVIEYEPPLRKTWETSAEPKLLVIGRYRMGFDLTPHADKTRLRVWIDYVLPDGVLARWLGRLLSNVYANWCVSRMIGDAKKAF